MTNLFAFGLIFILTTNFFYKKFKYFSGWLLFLYPLIALIFFISKYNTIANGKTILEKINWFPFFNIFLSFTLDGLSLTFAIIITLVGISIILYSAKYMSDYEDAPRFIIYLFIFMISMLGVVLSNNLIVLFVFWELTSVSSYLLIGFNHHKENARKAALQALLVTGIGGLSLLAGFILIYQITNTYELNEIFDKHWLLVSSPLYNITAILILFGIFTKSAQFPFHFWLPNAMEAPTPASAYLHSATMVKAGIYLIARLNHSFGGTEIWKYSIIISATITIILSAIVIFKQSDLKKILAYTTINALGFLSLLLGISGELGLKAFYIFLWAHSLYKASLFLTAGIIDHETGTRNVDILSGLKKYMPITFLSSLLAGSSMMGIIPLIGFISKEAIYAALLEVEHYNFIFITIAVLSNAAIFMATMLVVIKPFLGYSYHYEEQPREPHFQMLTGAIFLAILGLLIGLFPKFFLQSLLEQTVYSMRIEEFALKISLWHGFNFPLALSFLTMLTGILFYNFRNKFFYLLSNLKLRKFLLADEIYESSLKFIIFIAKLTTRIVQSGYLRFYLSFIILFALIFSGNYLLEQTKISSFVFNFDYSIYEYFIAILLISAAFFVVFSDSRLKSIVGLGAIGFFVGTLYVIYSAPDLALTTFAVETLTVILFVLVIYKLPKLENYSSLQAKSRDILISTLCGFFIFILIYFASESDKNYELKNFFAQNSFDIAKGRNIVNVILVDFRALDTLGEITVLSIAAIGVYTLLKNKRY